MANRIALGNEGLGFASAVDTYGGTVRRTPEGTLVWDMRGLRNRLDRLGDRAVRVGDDHVVRRPGTLLRRHPRLFIRLLRSGPKRARGEPAQIAANAARLGLADYYGPHPHGIAIKRPDVFLEGINLQDLYEHGERAFPRVDRHACLGVAARYIRRVHEAYGAIGELHPSDVIFLERRVTTLARPVLAIPDIVYNPAKYTPTQLKLCIEPRAVELLEFLLAVGTAELRCSDDWGLVGRAWEAVLVGYDDGRVIGAVGSLARRGRLTLSGDERMLHLPASLTTRLRPFLSVHNRVRLGMPPPVAGRMRRLVIERCAAFRAD